LPRDNRRSTAAIALSSSRLGEREISTGEPIVKTRVLLIAWIASVAVAHSASAESIGAVRTAAAGVLPSYEILTIIRSTGFAPIGQPVRNGQTYVLRAVDPYDLEFRLVVDARTGRILSVGEAPRRYAAPYRGAPPYDPSDAPVYGRIFGTPMIDDGFGPARPPASVPNVRPQAKAAAAPLPRPRPYVLDATGSIGSPPARKNPEAPKDGGAPKDAGASMPPVAPLE
jgi:hypothetical protein